ncbi:TetR/AcrR family transcriptional regulator [[Pseudomonas] carboxydohydrogena]|uniref:TetR/AcrR family transcriptional regulator n=1 Tax=Afipia carboxydohydrogena TaxID=290 RepID=A0ABY8BK97_AFICR|nr:TetR/AcrR family transcriptional regulator [[Pseudomonas] carboxydohydrogena]WEF50423.1 TetR/AcrR family transcriptional regulator [[Pseudomonas] carboxydohydrogena]
MRYARNHKAATRERILQGAVTRLKENGSGGIAIAELMEDAGLTHGGFYAHFKSRDALVEESFRHALEGIAQRWRARAEKAPRGEGLEAIVNGYLTREHRDDASGGCALPAIGAELARSSARTRRIFTERLEDAIDAVAAQSAESPAKVAREEAIGVIATMVGSLLLARAAGHEQLSADILKAGRKKALAEHRPRARRAIAKPVRTKVPR